MREPVLYTYVHARCGCSLAFRSTPTSAEKLEQALGALRLDAQVNWSPPENLHITTKFIGEWSENRLEEGIEGCFKTGGHSHRISKSQSAGSDFFRTRAGPGSFMPV